MEDANLITNLISGAIMLPFGIAACIYGASLWRKRQAVMTWAQTEGKIILSELRPGDETLDLFFSYEYHVSGVRYTSSQIVPENQEHSPFGIPDRYPVGATTTVYYNPDNPKDAVLEHGNNILAFASIGVGVIVIIFSIAYMFGFNVFTFFSK
jgi:hypothetical protein